MAGNRAWLSYIFFGSSLAQAGLCRLHIENAEFIKLVRGNLLLRTILISNIDVKVFQFD